MSRARSIEIYLKEGVEDDDQIYDVWSALRERGRPQAIFRQILKAGIRALNDSGDLPRVAAEVIDPEVIGTLPVARSATKSERPSRRMPDPHTVAAAISEGSNRVPRKSARRTPEKANAQRDDQPDITTGMAAPVIEPKLAETEAKNSGAPLVAGANTSAARERVTGASEVASGDQSSSKHTGSKFSGLM